MGSRIALLGTFVLGLAVGAAGMAGVGYLTGELEAEADRVYYPCAPRMPDQCTALPEATAVANFCQFAGDDAESWSVCQPNSGIEQDQ
jgi:hypothetical protein